MVCFDYDWCFIQVDPVTGFATVCDIWEGQSYDTFDSLEEALEYCAD